VEAGKTRSQPALVITQGKILENGGKSRMRGAAEPLSD
jgi:hypothetical protein